MTGNLKNQAMNSDLILVNQKVRDRPNEANSLKLWKADIKNMAG